MELTKNQQEIIELMGKGWSLALFNSYHAWATLQKGKIGYGRESKKVNLNTLFALKRKGLIEVKEQRIMDGKTAYKLGKDCGESGCKKRAKDFVKGKPLCRIHSPFREGFEKQ